MWSDCSRWPRRAYDSRSRSCRTAATAPPTSERRGADGCGSLSAPNARSDTSTVQTLSESSSNANTFATESSRIDQRPRSRSRVAQSLRSSIRRSGVSLPNDQRTRCPIPELAESRCLRLSSRAPARLTVSGVWHTPRHWRRGQSLRPTCVVRRCDQRRRTGRNSTRCEGFGPPGRCDGYGIPLNRR